MDQPVTTQLDTADIMKILQLLPHRYPFLLVDKIINIDADNSCIGIKNVTINEPQFQGHFPGRPVMPGVLILEGLAQTAGAMCLSFLGQEIKPQLVYFMTIDKARFRKPVVPGDTLHFHVQKLQRRGSVWRFATYAMVGDVRVAESEMSAMIADA